MDFLCNCESAGRLEGVLTKLHIQKLWFRAHIDQNAVRDETSQPDVDTLRRPTREAF